MGCSFICFSFFTERASLWDAFLVSRREKRSVELLEALS